MNIYAIKGHKVTVTAESSLNGYKWDIERVKDMIGKIYTVYYTIIHGSSTQVFLIEFPDISFNSVNFEDVEEQSEENDKFHGQWYEFN